MHALRAGSLEVQAGVRGDSNAKCGAGRDDCSGAIMQNASPRRINIFKRTANCEGCFVYVLNKVWGAATFIRRKLRSRSLEKPQKPVDCVCIFLQPEALFYRLCLSFALLLEAI